MTIMNLVAIAIGIGVSLLVILLGYRIWDNRQVRVHSSEQAVAMAKAEAGPGIAELPYRVDYDQDFWTVHFGPDEAGRIHKYLVMIWEKRAGRYEDATDILSLDVLQPPNAPPESQRTP